MSYDIQRCVRTVELTDREIEFISYLLEKANRENDFIVNSFADGFFVDLAKSNNEEIKILLEKFNDKNL